MQKRIDIPPMCYDIKKRIGEVKKLIVTDLDGTLLDSHSNLKDEYVKEIKEFLQDGIKLTIASGRGYDSIRPFAKKLGVEMPIICELGAFIVDPVTDRKILEKTIPVKVVRQTLNLLKNRDYLFNAYLCRGSNYNCFKNPEAPFFLDRKPVWKTDDDLMNIFNAIFKSINDYDDFSFKGIRKISIRFEESQFEKLKKELDEALSNNAVVKQSDTNCIDISPPGVSKGTALSYILDVCGINLENVMAIGDNETDSTMFEVVKYSVAVANGNEATKQMAKFVTLSNDENGVVYAIRKFLEE